jgi:outer membrane protein assembly factor BamB
LYQATVTSGRVIKFALDGTVLWRHSTVGAPSNNAVTPDEIPEVPALLGGALYLITAKGFIIALDQATGTENWRVAAHDHMPGDTFAITAALGVVIAATRGGASPANAADGSKLWDFDMGSEPAYNILVSLLKPAGADAVVVLCAAARGLQHARAVGCGRGDRAGLRPTRGLCLTRARRPTRARRSCTSLGSVYKVDLATGKQIWKVLPDCPIAQLPDCLLIAADLERAGLPGCRIAWLIA